MCSQESSGEARLGFVGIVLERDSAPVAKVNELISRHASLILARTGVPLESEQEAVITLIVKATTDQLGQLTGRLGQLPSVTVKSALTRRPKENTPV